MNSKFYTLSLISKLSELYKTHTQKQCANLLGLTPEQVHYAVGKYKLYNYRKKTRSDQYWTPAKLAELQELYNKFDYVICAKMMGVSPEKVKSAIGNHKLSCGRSGRFKKGVAPHNKGKKGWGKKNKGSFKKGNTPPTTMLIGTITHRKDTKQGLLYKQIKTSAHKWEYYHRFVWEQANGKIPPKHFIRFRDGNTLNCNIENLECISYAENMRRNMNPEKRAKSLQTLYRRERARKLAGLPGLSKHYDRIVNY